MYKFTNKEDMMKLVDAFTAANADKPCTIPFGEVVDGMKKYYEVMGCLLYTSPSPRDLSTSRMPSSA